MGQTSGAVRKANQYNACYGAAQLIRKHGKASGFHLKRRYAGNNIEPVWNIEKMVEDNTKGKSSAVKRPGAYGYLSTTPTLHNRNGSTELRYIGFIA